MVRVVEQHASVLKFARTPVFQFGPANWLSIIGGKRHHTNVSKRQIVAKLGTSKQVNKCWAKISCKMSYLNKFRGHLLDLSGNKYILLGLIHADKHSRAGLWLTPPVMAEKVGYSKKL